MSDKSIVESLSKNEDYKCGYCKSSNTNCSHGMWAHTLTVEDYQCLIDRGWRRSGCYCYKPIMNQTCCPCYTIKCDAIDFTLSKSKKRLLKKFNHFLATGDMNKAHENIKDSDRGCNSEMLDLNHQMLSKKFDQKVFDPERMEIGSLTSTNEFSKSVKKHTEIASSLALKTTESSSSVQLQDKPQSTEIPPPNSSKLTKSKQLRIERRRQKLLSRGLTLEEANNIMKASKERRRTKPKTLEDFIHFKLPENPKHRLEIRLVRSSPQSSLFKKTFFIEYEVYKRYQMSIHKDPPTKCPSEQFDRFLCNSPLQIKLINTKSREFAKSCIESGTLFTKYQMTVHKEDEDDADFSTYKNFLINSPLKPWQPNNGPSHGFGSFHQQYWLDGRLIAVGVIDILPRCISSVYFFYDPDFSSLSLGTISSLREIELTRSLQKNYPSLCNYYMGFYIHTCPKMRYKGNLKPSYLLCPEVYTWHRIEESRKLLDQNKYSRLNSDENVKDVNEKVNIDEVLILCEGVVMLYHTYKRNNRDFSDDSNVQEYGRLVGCSCATRMLLALNPF